MFRLVNLLTCAAMCGMLLQTAASAATYTVVAVGDGLTYTVVDADTFIGGTPGNTVRAISPATAWATMTASSTDSLWHDRAHSAFFGFTISGSAGNLFEVSGADRTTAPELVTTISGLAAGQYDVYLAYVVRDDNNADSGGLTANFNAVATTTHSDNSPSVIPGLNGTGVWDVAFARLGTTGASATGFSVNVKGTTATNRNDYIGVAYMPTPSATADLRVDFGNSKGTGGGPGGILAGFRAHEFFEDGAATMSPTTRTYSTSLGQSGTVDATISGWSHFRDYAAVTGTFASQSALLSDNVLRVAAGTMSLTLEDLKTGRHEITTYHHRTEFTGGTFDIVLTDGHVAGQTKFSGVTTSTGTNPSAVTSRTFQFYADNPLNGGTVQINFNSAAGNATLNGFQVHAGGPVFDSNFGASATTANLIDFGAVSLNGSATRTLTIENTSTSPPGLDPNLNTLSIDFDALMLTGADAGNFALVGAPTGVVTLAPGDTLDLVIEYTSMATDFGLYNDAFLTLSTDQDAVFGDFANGSSFSFQLQVLATPEPAAIAIWCLVAAIGLSFAHTRIKRMKSL